MEMFNLKYFLLIFLTYFIKDGFCQNRIVGGSNADIFKYRYQVSLQIWTDKAISKWKKTLYDFMRKPAPFQWAHNCGAAIVKEDVLVTAAHCVVNINDVRLMTICAGTDNTEDCSNDHRYFVNKVVPHKDFGLGTNDIALVIMANCFRFGPTLNAINYKDKTCVQPDNEVLLSGWGGTSPDTPPTARLQEITLTTISSKSCSGIYNVTENVICTLNGVGQGACQGDSGGPLVNKAQTCLLGVVSFGTPRCATGSPDVFTKVSVYTDWIDKNIKTYSKC